MADLYEFKMQYTQADKTGYYHTRWDQGGVAEVIASNREEAHQKLLTLLGSCPRGFGWGWAVKILSIRDHRIVAKEKTDG